MFRRSFAFLCKEAPKVCTEAPTKAVLAGKGPMKVQVTAGKTYAWCSCGLSSKQPFCDGSHRKGNEENGTQFCSVKFTADADGEVWFCACKKTEARPFCDGTHDSYQNCKLGECKAK